MAQLSLMYPQAQARLARIADGLVVAVAASLPWSTSATGVLLVLWLVALLPTLDWVQLRRLLLKPAGGLPLLLLLLGIAGMAWADVAFIERWKGLGSFVKLLLIPLLLVQFQRSNHSRPVFGGYLAACVALVAVSWIIAAWPAVWWPRDEVHYGVPVKNGATQSGEFVTCIAVLLYLAADFIRRGQRYLAAGALLIALAMLANILYVATSRTALVILAILILVWALRELSIRGQFTVLAVMVALAAAAWGTSPYFRARTVQLWTDYQKYEATDDRNSSGERIEFWRKSLIFMREAPIIGHGTGSIHSLFIKSAAGQTGAAASATTNPHNQTFAVGIQLGLVGVAVLWAMWVAHFLLFRGEGLVPWIGTVIVVQNVIGSLFNSHLFDFAQGWVYVIGVGVAGGVMLRQRGSPAATAGL